MLIGILGCNLAWGLIDGMLYVLGCAFERGRLHRIGYEVRATPSPLRARQLVAAELDELLVPLTDAQQRDCTVRSDRATREDGTDRATSP